jgi:hypothetical protein
LLEKEKYPSPSMVDLLDAQQRKWKSIGVFRRDFRRRTKLFTAVQIMVRVQCIIEKPAKQTVDYYLFWIIPF